MDSQSGKENKNRRTEKDNDSRDGGRFKRRHYWKKEPEKTPFSQRYQKAF